MTSYLRINIIVHKQHRRLVPSRYTLLVGWPFSCAGTVPRTSSGMREPYYCTTVRQLWMLTQVLVYTYEFSFVWRVDKRVRGASGMNNIMPLLYT